jgi:hypothetical protein
MVRVLPLIFRSGLIDTNSKPHRVLGNARLRREGEEILAGVEVAACLTGEGKADG